MALLAILFGSVAAIAWGVSDYFGARASKKFGGITTVFFLSILGTLLYAAIYFVCMRHHTQFNAEALLYAAGAGALYTIAMAAFFKGLELGPVSIVSPLGSTYPLVTTLLLVVLFGATITGRQSLAILLVVGGVIVAAGMLSKHGARKIGRGPLLALAAAAFWGATWALLPQAIHLVGWQQTTLIQVVACSLTFLVILPFIRGQEKVFGNVRQVITNKFLLGATVLQIVGLLALNIGIDKTPDLAAIVVAVSACYPALTVFLALRHLKEAFQLVPIVGAFTAVLGIVILSLG